MEAINSRIKDLILKEGLTASLFADKIGVLRSSLSHILSGRNKPGADFLEKLIISCPTINANWLLTGIGNPFLDGQRLDVSYDTADLNLTDEELENEDISSQAAEIHGQEELDFSQVVKTKAEDSASSGVGKLENGTNPTLVKVILVYSDATFKELKSGL